MIFAFELNPTFAFKTGIAQYSMNSKTHADNLNVSFSILRMTDNKNKTQKTTGRERLWKRGTSFIC